MIDEFGQSERFGLAHHSGGRLVGRGQFGEVGHAKFV